MHTEIEYAVNFIIETMKEKAPLSEEVYKKLKERLTTLLKERYENHWYEDKPMKGSAYRCINISMEDNSVDEVLRQAADDNGISRKTLLQVFDKGLALWVDPNDVSCRLGKGSIFFIYKKLKENPQSSSTSLHITTTSQRRPQQRPRSVSPVTSTNFSDRGLQEGYNLPTPSRQRSTTPPGFSSLDQSNLYQSYPRTALSSEDLQKLWNTIPNTTAYTSETSTSYSPATYVPSSSSSYNTYTNYMYNNYNRGIDSSYSFNQYSSYYNSTANSWKKGNRYQGSKYYQGKSNWQDDEVYQRYHWSRSDLKSSMSVAGNDIAMKNYGYSSARQVQEVC